jgi:hypothetical protein
MAMSILTRIPRWVAYALAYAAAFILGLFVAWRFGRAAGVAAFTLKAAGARVKLLKQAAEVRRYVEAHDHSTVSDKLSRWMRDKPGG